MIFLNNFEKRAYYLSFDYALSYYGLISEKVTAFTSATFDKKKKKSYDNQFGSFLYIAKYVKEI